MNDDFNQPAEPVPDLPPEMPTDMPVGLPADASSEHTPESGRPAFRPPVMHSAPAPPLGTDGGLGGNRGPRSARDGRFGRDGRGKRGDRDQDLRPRTSQQGMFDKQPPASTEAEMSLLGSMLLDHNVIGDVIQTVRTADQFFHEKHGAIYQALVDVYDQHRSGDLVQIVQHLRDGAVLDQIGGEAYLLRLAEGVPTSVNAPHYARIVAEKARLRRLIDAAGFILHEAYHVGPGPDESKLVLDRAETAIFDVAKEEETRSSTKLADLLDAELARLEAAEGKGHSGLKTGFFDLDKMTSGLQKDELIIVAARPSMGKTALALNLAEQIAFGGRTPEQGGVAGRDFEPVPVGIFSLEMSREALVQRLLSARSGIDQSKLRSGDLTDGEWNTLNTAAGQLYEAPIFLDDTPGLTLLGLRAKARRMHGQFGVRCIVIDYLQLLSAPGAARESRQNEVGAISRGIKALARELSIPIICLAQLNRGAEERRRPRMSDLRESGSIEQDADVVALLHREDYYHQGDEEWLSENEDQIGVAELILDKQRNGPTGVVKLTWSRETTRFKNFEAAGDYGGGYGGGNYNTGGGGGGGGGGGYGAPSGGHPPAPSSGYDSFGAPPVGGGYGSPSDAAERFPEVNVPPRQSFAPGPKTGPIENHRDGGGPDDGFDDDEVAPF